MTPPLYLSEFARDQWKHRHEFGFQHANETAFARSIFRSYGVPERVMYLATQEAWIAARKFDPTYAETSAAFRARGHLAQQEQIARELAKEEAQDEAITALRQIAAGHNDPRRLAEDVLAALDRL